MSKLVANGCKIEIKVSLCFKDESCGPCPKLGGTADKHIRPCQIDDRGDFLEKVG